MGYQYHQKRCGRDFSDDEKPVFLCQHCGKTYHSKAGRDYHIRTEHPPNISTTANKDGVTDSNNNMGKERVRAAAAGSNLDFLVLGALMCQHTSTRAVTIG